MKKFLIISFFSFFLFSGSILFSQEDNPVPKNDDKRNNEATAKLLSQKMPEMSETSVDEIKKLLSLGADLKATNNVGDTALHSYAAALNIDVVKYLVEQGADVTSKNLIGQNPAHFAVARNINLYQPIDSDKRVKQGNTSPITTNNNIANIENNPQKLSEVVKFLVSKGSDAFAIDQSGKNLVTIYLQNYKGKIGLDLLKSIINKDNINSQDRFKISPLHAAVSAKADISLLKYFCEDCKADVNLQNNSGSTPLHLAVFSPDLDIITLLIKNGADTNAMTKFGKSATQLLIENNANKILIKEIIAKNKINIADAYKGVDSPLHSIMRQSGEIERIKYFLELGVSINSRNQTNQTPLHIAATAPQHGDEKLKYLINNGADINAKDDSDRTPLHYAVSSELNTSSFIKYLIEKKADVNAKNKNDQPPLMELLKSKKQKDQKTEMLKFLIDHNAEVNIKDKNLSTPLHALMESRILQENIIKDLIKKGIDINAQNNDGQTALLYLMELFLTRQAAFQTQYTYISQKDCRDMIKLFMKLGADVGIKDKKNQTVFHAVVKGEINAEPEIIKELVKHGNDIDWSKEDLPAVCWAISNKTDQDVIEYFHKTKADFKKNTNVGESPLYLFIRRECNDKQGEINLEKIKYLVECGADINGGLKTYNPFLYYLQRCKLNLETVKYLVEKGADVRIKDDQGRNVLHAVIQNGYGTVIKFLDIVKYLVERGADAECQDNVEFSRPIHYAAFIGSLELVKYLMDQKIQVNVKTLNGDTPLHYAAKGGAENDLIKLLIQNGCSVNEKNKNNITPLICATKKLSPNYDTIKYLCEEAKAEINVKDNDGNTPLLSAIKFVKNIEIIKYLIERGADTKAIDNEGRNSLHCLCATKEKNDLYNGIPSFPNAMYGVSLIYKELGDLITILVDSGVDINSFDKRGMTPLLYAISSDGVDVEFISRLIQNGAKTDVKNSDGQSIILLFLMKSQDETNMKKMMELLKISFADENNKTLLHEIIRINKSDITKNIKFLVKAGYLINSRDRFGSTPLHVVVSINNISIDAVKALIENGADVNAKDNNDATPLHDAAEYCQSSKILEILIEAGANVNAKDIFGMTPLDILGIENSESKELVLRKALKKN